MITKASATFVRISPRKVRYVIDLVRRKPVNEAVAILSRTTKRAVEPVKKLILSAADAAKKVKSVDAENLYISKIYADQAGCMKRWRSMSMGRAGMIRKRLSHINIELDRMAKPVVQPKEEAVKAEKQAKGKKTQKAAK